MPVKPTYPGVYIEEIPSGVRTVTGVATSVAAFVGHFPKGLQNEAVHIFSMADFEREYGGIDRDSPASYAVQQFFLNGGGEAHIVRVAHDGSGGATAAVAASVVLTAQPAGAGDQIVRVRAGRRIRGGSAADPGAWGNFLRVEVDYDTTDPAALFNLTISEVAVDGDRTSVVQTETFRNLTMRPDTPNNAVEVVNQGSRLVQLDRAGLTAMPAPFVPTFRPAATGTLGGALPTPVSIPADDAAFNVTVTGVPTVNGTLQYGGPVPTSYSGLRPFLEQAIRRAAADATVPDALKPLLAGATVQLIGAGTVGDPHRYLVRSGRASRPFNPAATLTFGGAGATAARLAGATAAPNVQQHPAAGGVNGRLPLPAGVIQGSRAAKTGMFALEDVDLFNILCIPEAAEMTNAGDMRSIYAQAEAYCEERRSMVIVDIPATVATLDQMQTWLSDNESLRHPNAAVYFPRTLIPDPASQNRPRSLAACGTIAGLWARTDAQRGVWKAPAGTDARLRNVQSLAYLLTDMENGVLNQVGVNCLRTFPVYSSICWGARTLEGADLIASDWKYIPVRRTTLFIQESLYRGTKWAVFEPNDEPLWAQIRLNLGAFMQDLFRKGAFQGSSPRDAYFVKCDGETTTQNDINNGIVNVEVGFAPLKPAEFVIIKIRQIAGQIET
ncbi:MAG: phage tail sheath family protein [Alphaproteobacteria bacterium]